MSAAATARAVEGLRLSPQQRRIWRDGEEAGILLTRALVSVEGPVDEVALRRALEEIVRRHEILRTGFFRDVRRKFPLQVVRGAPSVRWQRLDHVDPWCEGLGRAFDLQDGPTLDVLIVRHDEERHDLVLQLPALCTDPWSMRLLAAELAAGYEAGSSRQRAATDPIQYAQYAEWLRELEHEGSSTGMPELVRAALPFEGPRAERADLRWLDVEITGELEAALAAMGARPAASLEAVLLASWQALLFRLCGRGDFSLAVASAGRGFEDVGEVMGPVETWISLLCQVHGDVGFEAVIRSANVALTELAQGEPSVDPGGEGRELSDLPGFCFTELPAAITTERRTWRLLRTETPPPGLKLTLAAQHRPGALRLTLWYDGARIGEDAAAGVLRQYRTMLADLAGREDAGAVPLGSVVLLDANEREEHLRRARGGAIDAPFERGLHELVALHAAARPDAPAVVSGTAHLTYSELEAAANRWAHHLRRRGVGAGALVGLCCERSVDMIVGLLAILGAGGAYVPLDPRAPAERLAQQIRVAGFSFLLGNGEVAARLPAAACTVLPLDHPQVVQDEPDAPLDGRVLPDEVASVVFTSGSTGIPKGVAITHRGIAIYTRAVTSALAIESGWHFATVSTLSADLGNTSIFGALATGGCLHIIDYATATDGLAFSEYCERWPIDVLKIVPSHLAALLDAGAAVLPRRRLVLGGEALLPAFVDRIRDVRGDCRVFNHYGPTETTVGALVLPVDELVDRRGCQSIPIGRPLSHAEAYVLDEGLAPAPTGTPGELYLGGGGLARGYLDRPDLTAERFVPHPFADGARLYRTGDRARYRPDGTVEFLGRRDHQVKIRGFRVELGEVEARLCEHPAIAQAVAFVRDEPAGRTTLVAYVVVRDGELEEDALRTFLADRLPEYMIPSTLVRLAALPLTANGKLNRAALPAPAVGRGRPSFVEPRTPAEKAIAAIWAEMLKVPRVGVDDDFFALGGHSLLAIPLMHRIHKALGGSLSLAAIFKTPTVAGLARHFEAADRTERAVVLRAGGDLPPLFCVDPTGWNVGAYEPLAEGVGGERPVLGLEIASALGVAGEQVELGRIAELLARNVRAQQPHGPYHLLGWSLGGVLALATAEALEAMGQPVAFLGIVDTDPRVDLYRQGPPDPVEELAAYVDVDQKAALLSLPGATLDELRQRLLAASGDARIEQAVTWAQERGFLARGVAAGLLRQRYQLLRQASLFVSDRHKRVQAPIHAWWSEDTLGRQNSPAQPPINWQSFTLGTAQVTTLPGDHASIVKDATLAQSVRAALSVRANG